MTSTLVENVKNAGLSGTAATEPSRRALRVCMLTYSFYESDTRILQYANALARRGDSVDVIALQRDESKPVFEVLDGVNVYRIQSRTVNEKGLMTFARRILRFLLRATWFLRRQQRERRYDLIHVHNVPDFLVFGALFPKVHGVPVILDIHDLLPEFYASKFKISKTSLVFRILAWVERCSASFANHAIIANHVWHDRYVERSSRPEKCSVVRNHPDLSIFIEQGREARDDNGVFRLTYPGSLNAHQGLDVAIRAFASVADRMPNAEFHIYGDGPAKPSLIDLALELKMTGRVFFHDFVPTQEVARIMAATDLAVEPKRATSQFGNEALSTKILEFMALGVPVVASKTRIHAYYYDDSIIQYYENDDANALSAEILNLYRDPELRKRLSSNAKKYVRENTWEARQAEYLGLVDSMVVGKKNSAK